MDSDLLCLPKEQEFNQLDTWEILISTSKESRGAWTLAVTIIFSSGQAIMCIRYRNLFCEPQIKWVGSERYCKNVMDISWTEGYIYSLARGSRELKGERCQNEKHPNLQRISARLYLSQSYAVCRGERSQMPCRVSFKCRLCI